jgi:hypothetical protein
MNYTEAKALFNTARDKVRGAAFGRRTRADVRVVKTSMGYGVKVYGTVVVEFCTDGCAIIDHGGYQTVTSKEWINEALKGFPYKGWSVYVYQEKGEWFVGKMDKKLKHCKGVKFKRFTVVSKGGRITN